MKKCLTISKFSLSQCHHSGSHNHRGSSSPQKRGRAGPEVWQSASVSQLQAAGSRAAATAALPPSLSPSPPQSARNCAPSAFRLPHAVEYWLTAIACVVLVGLWPSIASTAANTPRLRFQPLHFVFLAIATGLLPFNELQPRCFSCPPLPLLYRHRRPQKAARGPMQCSSGA